MKVMIVLAALMMVPTMAYFQTQRFEGELQGELRGAVEGILAEAGVRDAEVRMDWQDVTMGGVLDSAVAREAVLDQVKGLAGVRLARGGNQLEVAGWLKVVRESGVLRVTGLLPKGEKQFLRFAEDVTLEVERMGGEVGRAEWVTPPAGAMEWNEFVAVFFSGPGNRSVDLRGGRMVLGGEVTSDGRREFLAKAQGVVGAEGVVDEMVVHEAERDFESYVPNGMVAGVELEKLRQVLASSVVVFDPESVELGPEEVEKVATAAAAILEAGEKLTFLVEGHPMSGGGADVPLGLKRAVIVERLLLGYGVRAEQLEVVTFGSGGAKTPENRVEIIVK